MSDVDYVTIQLDGIGFQELFDKSISLKNIAMNSTRFIMYGSDADNVNNVRQYEEPRYSIRIHFH